MKRKQFTFYLSFHETIENFRTKSEQLEAYKVLCDYALYGKAPELEGLKPSVLALFLWHSRFWIRHAAGQRACKKAAKCSNVDIEREREKEIIIDIIRAKVIIVV